MASLRGGGRVVLVVSVCRGARGYGEKVGLFFMGSLHGVLNSEEELGQWDTHSLIQTFSKSPLCAMVCAGHRCYTGVQS